MESSSNMFAVSYKPQRRRSLFKSTIEDNPYSDHLKDEIHDNLKRLEEVENREVTPELKHRCVFSEMLETKQNIDFVDLHKYVKLANSFINRHNVSMQELAQIKEECKQISSQL